MIPLAHCLLTKRFSFDFYLDKGEIKRARLEGNESPRYWQAQLPRQTQMKGVKPMCQIRQLWFFPYSGGKVPKCYDVS